MKQSPSLFIWLACPFAALVLTALPPAANAQNLVTATAAADVAVFDRDHHAIGTRKADALKNRPVVGGKDAFGFLAVDLGTEKVWVRSTTVTVSGKVAPPPAGPCLVMGPQARSSQVGSTNGLAARCKNAE